MSILCNSIQFDATLGTSEAHVHFNRGQESRVRSPWLIRISNPKSEAAEVYLKDTSLSTSGSYEKFFEAEGKRYSHLMDPRTGFPARGMLSVSVLAPQTLDSEAWTKPVFINPGEWTRAHLPEGLRAFVCEESKPCYWTPGPPGSL